MVVGKNPILESVFPHASGQAVEKLLITSLKVIQQQSSSNEAQVLDHVEDARDSLDRGTSVRSPAPVFALVVFAALGWAIAGKHAPGMAARSQIRSGSMLTLDARHPWRVWIYTKTNRAHGALTTRHR